MSHKFASSMEARLLRLEVRYHVACPKCGATPGQKCFTVRRSGEIYVRARSHQERWDAFREAKTK